MKFINNYTIQILTAISAFLGFSFAYYLHDPVWSYLCGGFFVLTLVWLIAAVNLRVTVLKTDWILLIILPAVISLAFILGLKFRKQQDPPIDINALKTMTGHEVIEYLKDRKDGDLILQRLINAIND
jgi:ABC-type Mn2+/Zn2+ transport system permease subunit